VILDGGKGQLSAGLDALADAGRLQIPIVALAKEREELFLPNRADPIVLPRNSQGMYLVQRIRDEAHRFAITYHQRVRAKRAVHSAVSTCPRTCSALSPRARANTAAASCASASA